MPKFVCSWPVQLTGIVTTLLLVGCYVYQPSWLRILDYKLYDNVLRKNHTQETKGVVVIVDLDEKSLERYGQWPWPRYRLALLLQKLRQAGVKAVGMDILFAEPDRSSPYILQRDLKNDLQVDIGFSGLPKALRNNDEIFAQTLRQGPFVLGFFFDFVQESSLRANIQLKDINPVILASEGGLSPDRFLLSAPAALPPLALLSEAAPATGFINTIRDRDGVLRRTPLIMMYDNKIYANLGFSVLLTALGRPQCVVKMSEDGVESVRFGKTVVPLDKHGRIQLHYRGPSRTFPYISAADILDGNVQDSELRGKIVFIGTSAAGLRDLRTIPLGTEYPGVEAHATLIDNILTGDFITLPDWLPGLELCLTLAAGLVTTILVCWLSAWYILPVIIVFIGGCWYAGMWAFANYHFYFSPLFPILATGVNFSLLSFAKFLRTDQQKRFIRQAFSKYVSSSVVDKIVESPDRLRLEGEEKELSILFSDIRGFTSLSEKLSPSQVTSLLNSYFTPITKVIVDHQGTIDKFIGDAIMAFWNAPLDVDDHKEKAVSAGLTQLNVLSELNEIFQESYGLTLEIGIGLHAGTVSVGNMGSDDLFDYTIIGDNVNLTSRLEGLTKFYGVPLIVSEAMIGVQVEGYSIQSIDEVRVKGKEKPVRLYTFRQQEHIAHKELERWQEVLGMYRNRNFSPALDLLKKLLEEQPEFHLYSLYQNRCERFLSDPPAADWDGIYSHISK